MSADSATRRTGSVVDGERETEMREALKTSGEAGGSRVPWWRAVRRLPACG